MAAIIKNDAYPEKVISTIGRINKRKASEERAFMRESVGAGDKYRAADSPARLDYRRFYKYVEFGK